MHIKKTPPPHGLGGMLPSSCFPDIWTGHMKVCEYFLKRFHSKLVFPSAFSKAYRASGWWVQAEPNSASKLLHMALEKGLIPEQPGESCVLAVYPLTLLGFSFLICKYGDVGMKAVRECMTHSHHSVDVNNYYYFSNVIFYHS